MGYLFSKLLTNLAMPLSVGGLLILTGVLVAALRRTALGSWLALFGLFWIWLWATPAFSDWVRKSLEGHYAPTADIESVPTADAILVLGGGVESISAPRAFPDLNAAADRVWHAARLFHLGKAPLVVLSGGRQPWAGDQGPEANAMLRFLTDLGVPRNSVLLEQRSRNTYENARETSTLLATRGVEKALLVTSALHMRRAEATFRAAGIDVIPAPTDYEVVFGQEVTLLDYLPEAGALEGSSRALKEYLGLIVYQRRRWARP